MSKAVKFSPDVEKCLKKIIIATEKAKGNEPKGNYRLTDGKYHINITI